MKLIEVDFCNKKRKQVTQQTFIQTDEVTMYKTMSRDDLERYAAYRDQQLEVLNRFVKKIQTKAIEGEQERIAIRDELLVIRHKFYGKASEKGPSRGDLEKKKNPKKTTERKPSLPSLRYPELPLVESLIQWEVGKEKDCRLCGKKLTLMGSQTENSEYVTVVQKTYHVVKQQRQKYRCSCCHGDIQTVEAPPRINPGGTFSDEVAIDVAVSKYADHIPIERYVMQAERQGLHGVHPQTLIDQTHKLADLLETIHQKLKTNIQQAGHLHADETPWKMLEGDETPNWQLWGFFNEENSYYEAHDTRAGAIAEEFLMLCKATHLVSDAYSGYGKSVKKSGKTNSFCNAHSRRKFKEAEPNYPEAIKPIEIYEKLYAIEREIKGKPPDARLLYRQTHSIPLLAELKSYLFELNVLPQSTIGKARDYTLKNWDALTEFTRYGYLPIDNNLAERGLRGPVQGRKNYYGNHSKRGAKTMQILYSVIESCKLCGVEPYKYLKDTTRALLLGQPAHTPAEYRKITI